MKLVHARILVVATIVLTASAATAQYNPPPSQPSQTQPAAPAPAPAAPAPAPAVTNTVDGQIQAISISCSGAVPDTCSANADIVTGAYSTMANGEFGQDRLITAGYGPVTRIYIPAGMLVTFGNRQAPVTALRVGDEMRIDYATSTANDLNIAVNTASAGTVVKAGQ